MRKIKSSIYFALSMTGVALLATGCLNVFSPIDGPSGDAQLLSAARACFDRGDYACAQSNYQKLSTSYSEIASHEQAMAILDQNGAGMGAFLTFVGNGADGRGLTAMAEGMTPGSQTKRSAIYGALVQSGFKNGGTRTQLQYFTQFMASLALAAEILAEVQGNSSQLLKSQIVDTPNSCNTGNCAISCAYSGSSLAATSTTDFATTEPTGASPTIDMLYWAIKYAYEGINGLGSGGSFSSTGSDLNAIFSVGQPGSNAVINQCFRAQLLNFKIGR